MTAVELLGAAFCSELPETPADGVCCVTGATGPTIDREHAIKQSFTNLDLLRAPDSDRVGVAAYRAMTEPAQRKSSWICDRTGFRKLQRLDVRELVLDGVPAGAGPWAGYVTTSYKKHGVLRAPVNTGSAQRWLFELDVIDCSDRKRVADWWGRLSSTREAGIPRPVIECLDIGLPLMRKHLALWSQFEPWARARVRAPLYRFLTYLLPGQEELNAREQD